MAETAHRGKHSGAPAAKVIASFEQHNKTFTINAAARAVRPASAITGLGEKAGWQAQRHSINKPVGSQQQQTCSSRPYSAAPSTGSRGVRGPRDIFPVDLQLPPRFRKHGHEEPSNYSPLQRFDNLGMLETKFQGAFRCRELPLALTAAGQQVRWQGTTPEGKAMRPANLAQQQYQQLLPLLFEGVREGHEPYRYLASQAALDLLSTAAYPAAQQRSSRGQGSPSPKPPQSQWLLDVLPELAAAVKAGLNTMQPSLAAHTMLMLQRLLLTNNSIGPALVPHYKHLLPAMTLLMGSERGISNSRSSTNTAQLSAQLLLPPPFCLPPAGAFSGHGPPPLGSPSCCSVCGAVFGSTVQNKVQQEQQQLDQAYHPQEGVCGEVRTPARVSAPPFGGETPAVHLRAVGAGLKPRRCSVLDVVQETLQLMVECGGPKGLAAVRLYCPTYDYCHPVE